ncbi:hypothetical protein [Melittangium boletus]|uniref:Uncharacterized protein n=1 Tax=Melittangium boletus DSM 14713 TaxID=1294270 RepID=A0A250IEF3_9BACT|nr:hypothetical protein [Melittangium boletus]ATB30145.1 hypothetical protein MEBOL_003600 [Melittangium boletus DSM 14713]
MAFSVQLHAREDFEVRTLRALGGAAVLAPLVALGEWLHVRVDVAFIALVGAGLASARVGWKTWVALAVGLPALLSLPELLRLPVPAAQVLMGVLAASMVGLWNPEWKPRPEQVLAGALGAGALVPLGMYVRRVLDARLLDGLTGPLHAAPGLAVVALFWSVGRLASHLEVHANTVEARGARLRTRMVGEPQELVARTVTLYRECRAETAQLGSAPGRKELERVLDTLALEVFNRAEAHAQLESQLKGARMEDVNTQVTALRTKATATTDAVARRQLELAAGALGEELNQLETMGRKRERLLAQLHAQVAMMERARVSLVAVRGGDVAAKGEQAAQLARRLAELGQEDAGGPPAQ